MSGLDRIFLVFSHLKSSDLAQIGVNELTFYENQINIKYKKIFVS